jgi:3-hydroxyisobutyrate dehydrogenase-like beta-hydroxyacid dehydrogenase
MQRSGKGAVGVIGLGIMGGAIARNLAEAGWTVVGHDIDAARAKELAAAEVEIVASAGEVARRAATILTSLPHAEALHATAREIVATKSLKRVVAELSTFAIEDKEQAERTLSADGHVLLDCPLSGTGAQATTKDLVVYASGDSASIAGLRPLFADFSREAHDLGAFGNGMKMKLVANLLVAIHNVATAEAFVLGTKAGLDPRQIFQLAKSGAGNSRVLELRGPMMVEGRYEPATMKVSVWQKDMELIHKFAAALAAPTPLFEATAPIYHAALAQGLGAQDTAAVCAVLEQQAGVRRKTGAQK